jgi:mRNA-degrading endonuclease RelE of RelBE toxin-antitoxin system
MYEVLVKKTAAKYIEKAPDSAKILFKQLVQDLQAKGAIQHHWPNYSKLSKNKFHCHLNDSYVAC